MSRIFKIEIFAHELIRQKRIIHSIENTLLISFIFLSVAIVLAIPLRYFMGIDFVIALFLYLGFVILSFIYGFLGIENPLSVLKETDARMTLNEKLSAAYQFGETTNPYSILLVRDAEEIIKNLSARDVFQVNFSRRDPFQPLLLALFLFLWMSSFSLLQMSDQSLTIGEILMETSLKIDAVNNDGVDKNLEDIAEEYRKLGQKIQDQFMSEHSIDREVDKLSRKLENKIEELSRKGVNKDSQTLEEDLESEIFQRNRKKEMSEKLNDILQSLMKTFSRSPAMVPGSARKGDGENSGGERFLDENDDDSEEQQESHNDGASNNKEPGSSEEIKENEEEGTKQNPDSMADSDNDKSAHTNAVAEDSVQESTHKPLREKKESGEFDDENIEGELLEGEQMKSFIRALPHIIDPTLKEREVLYFYKNQLENTIDREILPEDSQTVVRDYFLSIGVLDE